MKHSISSFVCLSRAGDDFTRQTEEAMARHADELGAVLRSFEVTQIWHVETTRQSDGKNLSRFGVLWRRRDA